MQTDSLPAELSGKPQLNICSKTKDNRTTSTWQKRQRSSFFKNPTPSIVTHKWAGFYIYRDLFLVTQDGKESACSAGDPGSIPGPGRSPGERNDNPLQYSCLGNPMDRGAWQTTVHGGHEELGTTERFHFFLKTIGLCGTFYVSTLGTCTRKTSHQNM